MRGFRAAGARDHRRRQRERRRHRDNRRSRRRARGDTGRPRLRPSLRHRRGRRQAECGIIVFMDGDGSDRADLMPLLLAPIQAGTHDFVIGSRVRGVREKGAMSWHQVLGGPPAWRRDRRADRRALHRHVRLPSHQPRCAGAAAAARDDLWLEHRDADAGSARWPAHSRNPLPYRRRTGGHSKVAGSLRGSLRAGWRIGVTFVRVAMSARPA